MESKWLEDSLFAGMTSSAFKLGTVLTLGWFWTRVSGCSVLYHGGSMEEIDFDNILAVTEIDACRVSPPGYVQHNSGSVYFYVVRRANICGCQEHTLSAAVKVVIGADGNLVQPQPNEVFDAKAEQVDGGKVHLVWYYCPLEQKAEPICFNVYYDGGTGRIDYQNPIATVSYIGRAFYSYQSDTLDAGGYLFAIRAEGANGMENSSLAQLIVQLDTTSPTAIDIIGTEAI